MLRVHFVVHSVLIPVVMSVVAPVVSAHILIFNGLNSYNNENMRSYTVKF